MVTSQQLNAGITFNGRRYPIWNQQQGIFRPALLREPGAALTIHTSFSGPYDDRWAPEDERLVYRYQGDNPQHRDNVALRRAMELQRPVLYLVAIRKGVYDVVAPCYVTGDEPSSLTFFLIADSEEYVPGELSDSLLVRSTTDHLIPLAIEVTMSSQAIMSEYEAAVSNTMQKRYGITWQDASGDTQPLESAIADGWTPEQFVRWFGERYDLEPVSSRGWT